MTKEAILGKKDNWEVNGVPFNVSTTDALEAMQEYSDQQNKELKEIVIQLQKDFVLKLEEYAKKECIHLLDFLNETLTLKDGDYWLDGELVAYPHETDIIYKLYLTYNLNNKQ